MGALAAGSHAGSVEGAVRGVPPPSTGCGQRLWTVWTTTARRLVGAGVPVDGDLPRAPRPTRLPGMAIEVVPAQLYALAGVLDAAAAQAARIGGELTAEPVGGPLAEALAVFCETAGTAGRCLGAELEWLGSAVAAAADSWLGLDGSLLPALGRSVSE
jgi:hypothetical protein